MPLPTFVQRCGVPHFLVTYGAVIDLKFLETGYQWLWINLEHKIFFENFAHVMVFADPGSYTDRRLKLGGEEIEKKYYEQIYAVQISAGSALSIYA